MARKKSEFENLTGINTSRMLSTPRSYASLLYGALTVVVLFIILFLGIRAISERSGKITEEAEKTTSQKTYEVKEGDSLWTIAEQEYKDGFKWTEIAKANKIANPDVIEKGMKLTLPAVVAPEAAMEIDKKITADSYKVAEGDNLWDISVRAYGDGYKWVEVARANSLSNPDIIHKGNQLKLPR